MTAPNSTERHACWKSRDEFWKCLDENAENVGPCDNLKKSFEASCPAQWVKYFTKRRDFLKYKEKMEHDGFEYSQQSPK